MSSMSSTARCAAIRDLVGIGFGPSNLALAIAVAEHNQVADGNTLDSVFFDRQERFGWHRGMLIDSATMQISFLKDLVTMRDPGSRFSFLYYLNERGRLADFINSKCLFPSRVEFHSYLEWAANHVQHLVWYGCEVVEIRPVPGEEAVDYLDVVVRRSDNQEITVHRTRNVVIAAGMRPSLPPGVEITSRIWHNYDLLNRLDALPPGEPVRFVVVGAGQSAAETTEYLHRRFPASDVCAVFSRYGYSPSDDTSFANRIFDPEAVDHFFSAPEDVKRLLLAYHSNTNYSVVDPELIGELYRRTYQEKVCGRQRLHILNACRVVEVEESTGGLRVVVEFLPTGEHRALDADALVYATGYRPVDPTELLGELAASCLRTPCGELAVERDYKVRTTERVRCGIYVQGATEHTHGITSTLLSNTAVRVGEIVRSILERLPPSPRGSAQQLVAPLPSRWAAEVADTAPGPARCAAAATRELEVGDLDQSLRG